MYDCNSTEDLREYVNEVASNRIEKDPSPIRYVANQVISEITVVGGEVTLKTSAAPYHDVAINPGDVIEYSRGYGFDTNIWRKAAVDIMAKMIEERTEDIEPERAEAQRLKQIEDRRERYFDRHGHF